MDFINGLIGSVMAFFNSITGNYILALLLFAVVAKLIFLPLDIKQQKNSIKQAKMRPKEMAIRNKYKGRTDRATQMKMQQEIQEMYQKEGYSPFSGCLPMLIQLPLIFILYAVIRSPLSYICGLENNLIDVMANTINTFKEGANFSSSDQLSMVGAIKDLIDGGGANFEAFKTAFEGASNGIAFGDFRDSLPNFMLLGQNFGTAPQQLGFFSWLIIVPALNFIVQYFSTKLMKKFQPQPIGQDASAQTSMKIMEFTVPLMTVFFSYTMSAAIGMYWIFQNLISLLERFLISRAMPLPTYTEAEIKEMEKAAKAASKSKASSSTPRAEGERPRSLHRIDEDDDEPASEQNKKPESKAETKELSEPAEEKELTEQEKKNTKTAEKLIGEAPALKDESDKYSKKKKKQ